MQCRALRADRALSQSREAARTLQLPGRAHRNHARHQREMQHCRRRLHARDRPSEIVAIPAAIVRDAGADPIPKAPIDANPRGCQGPQRWRAKRSRQPPRVPGRSASMHSQVQQASSHRWGTRRRPFQVLVSGPTGYAPLSRSSNKSETDFGFTCQVLTGQVKGLTLRLNIGCWTSSAVECTILAPAQRT